MLTLLACTQPPVPKINIQKSSAVADSNTVNKLIARGIVFQNSGIDSLPKISGQLYRLSITLNNNKARVYAEVFDSYYDWMGAKYPLAIQLAIQALADAERWKITKPIPEIYGIRANLHKETGNYDVAFADNDKGLAVARSNKDTAEIISFLGQQAMFTHSFYPSHKHNGHTSLQLEFDALAMAESQPKYEQMRIKFYDNIAQEYLDHNQFNKTIFYANKGIQLANKYHQLRSLTYGYCWLGIGYYNAGRHDQGIDYIKQAQAISRQIALPYRQMELYQNLYQCYNSSKDYGDAFTALQRYYTMRDSLQVAKNEKQISEFQVKYESVKKDKEIATLNEQNRNKSREIFWEWIGLSMFVVLLVIILYQYFIIHRNNKLIKLNNEMLNEALLKIAHIQSHHIRKPLASIMGLMNLIKDANYEADKELLMKMDAASLQLDKRIREVITHAETDPPNES